MLDPGYLKRNQAKEDGQPEEDEAQLMDRPKPSRPASTINPKRSSRPESVLSHHAPHPSLSSRSSRMHIDHEGENYSAASSVRRKPKGTNASMSSLGFSDGHVGMASNGGSRQSLAFELAAAMDPTENDQSSILDSLGLGDDDEDEEEGYGHHEQEQEEAEAELMNEYTVRADEEQEDELDHEQRRRDGSMDTRMGSRMGSSPGWHDGRGLGSPRKSAFRDEAHPTPTTRRARRSSRSTINTAGFSPHKSSFGYGMADEYGEGAEEDVFGEESELYESDGSEADEERARTLLESGLVSTAHFLAILKQSNTDYVPPPTGLVSNLTTDQSSCDRQPAVEKLIGDLVRTMADNVREREAQIRELKEIEVALSYTDRRALAEVDPLPMLLEETDFRTYIVGPISGDLDESFPVPDERQEDVELEVLHEHGLGDGQTTPLAHHASAQSLRPISVYSADSPATRKSQIGHQAPSLPSDTGSRIVSIGTDPQASPMNHLNQLKLVTTSLINSLNLINEHTQIGRQTQTEVVRKLKGVRGLVTNWKADHESLEHSKECIGRWESEFGLDDPSARKVRGTFEVQIRLATAEAEKLLEEASERARSLLIPPEPIST